jgi:hypothetical protein
MYCSPVLPSPGTCHRCSWLCPHQRRTSGLQFLTYKAERTFFLTLDCLKRASVDGFPSCFLPTFTTLAAVNSIIFTTNYIITVQECG